jgi:RNA polymerase sigma factor (sigma-70 family)
MEIGGDDFEHFYRQHRIPLVRAVALVLNDADLARDAVAEAMARAFQAWASVGGHGNPAGWVYVVALNWARNAVRKRSRESAQEHGVAVIHTDRFSDPDLERALQALSPKLLEVVVLRFYLDWSQRQIAAALDVPEGSVKSRLHRALDRLSRELEGSEP